MTLERRVLLELAVILGVVLVAAACIGLGVAALFCK